MFGLFLLLPTLIQELNILKEAEAGEKGNVDIRFLCVLLGSLRAGGGCGGMALKPGVAVAISSRPAD